MMEEKLNETNYLKIIQTLCETNRHALMQLFDHILDDDAEQ